jgi:hypothetical protein
MSERNIVAAAPIPKKLVGGNLVCPDIICAHVRNAKYGDADSVESLRNLLHLAADTMATADIIEVATFIHRAGETMLWRIPKSHPIGAPLE